MIADAAYPLQKSYPEGQGKTQDQWRFNYKLSRARMCVEGAFGRLKTQWRRSLKRSDHSVKITNQEVTACCILHDIWWGVEELKASGNLQQSVADERGGHARARAWPWPRGLDMTLEGHWLSIWHNSEMIRPKAALLCASRSEIQSKTNADVWFVFGLFFMKCLHTRIITFVHSSGYSVLCGCFFYCNVGYRKTFFKTLF